MIGVRPSCCPLRAVPLLDPKAALLLEKTGDIEFGEGFVPFVLSSAQAEQIPVQLSAPFS